MGSTQSYTKLHKDIPLKCIEQERYLMSEHEDYHGRTIHVNQHKVQPVQQVWICVSFRGCPKVTERKRNKKMKSHHDIVDASPRPLGNAPSVSAICSLRTKAYFRSSLYSRVERSGERKYVWVRRLQGNLWFHKLISLNRKYLFASMNV